MFTALCTISLQLSSLNLSCFFFVLGFALIHAAYVMCSMLIVVSSAPFEKEIRTRKEEKHLNIPPVMPLKREEIGRYANEEEEREFEVPELQAVNEFPAKEEREFSEENEEEFFKRLERELAMQAARREIENRLSEEGRLVKELQEREVPKDREEMSKEDEENNGMLAERREVEMFKRELEKGLVENLAREMAEEEQKGEFGEDEEEDIELSENPDRVFTRELPESEEKLSRENDEKRELSEEGAEGKEEDEGLPEESEEESKREFKSEVDEEEIDHKREDDVEENEEDEAENPGESKSFMDELERFPVLSKKSNEIETLGESGFVEHMGEKFPQWNENFDHQPLRAGLQELNKHAKEFPKHMREQEAERERQSVDHYGNNENREREELRERQRERALENGRKFHEREMEGRKQRQEIGPDGIRREQRERFRFRARGQ